MNGGLDDDIEILYHKSPEQPLRCQLCNETLKDQTPEQRQAHYNRHFDDEPQSNDSRQHAESSRLSGFSIKSNSFGSGKRKQKERDTFWYSAQTTSPPSNFVPGLIPVLKGALVKSHAKGNTTRAVLCYDRTVHIARDVFDMTWGCGYRNFMMVCTALMDQPFQPLYFPLLDTPFPPGVRNLQRWIEAAWKDGFDPEGAQELGHKLVDTKKWIGTAELYVAFTSRGIPAKLVDFDFRSSSNTQGAESLTNWVVQHFSPSSLSTSSSRPPLSVADALRGAVPIVGTHLPPLVLQHDGHSRTVVGYEVSRKGAVNLLVFDPSKPPNHKLRNVCISESMPATSTPGPSSSHTLQQLLYPLSSRAPSRGKRQATEGRNSSKNKRTRHDENYSTNADVVVIDSDSEHNESTIDPMNIVNFFRLDPKKLGRKNRYQILYFPLDDPLDEHERAAKKVVTSTKIC